MLRHVGGAADFILMAGDEHTVSGHDQVGLDVVGALLDRQSIGLEGVLGPFAARAAMRNDKNVWTRGTLSRVAARV